MNVVALSLNETVAFFGGVASVLLINAIGMAWSNYIAYQQRKKIIELMEAKNESSTVRESK